MKNIQLRHLIFAFVLITTASSYNVMAQCLVEGPNIQYTPNPSNTIVNNGTEYVKLYINVCERFQSDPTLSDAEVASLVQEVNSDFLAAGIEFFYCLERHYDPDFTSSDAIYTSELTQRYSHDDGIDVYTLPKDYIKVDPFNTQYAGAFSFNSGNPNLPGVAAQEVVFWGQTTLCEFPFFPVGDRFIQVPHALSHELGHCLGLLHPHETFPCADLTGVNCTTCGDLLCETQPSEILRFCVNQNCERVEHTFTCNPFFPNDTYIPNPNTDPDLDNIMAYTNFYACSPIFVAEQNDRMKATLQNHPLLQPFRFHFIGSNITINGNETWPLPGFPPSGNAYIGGNLTISPNAQLQINSGRIQFAPTAKLIIQPQGRLNLFSTLTSWCDIWQGVEVQGNAGMPQSLTTHGLMFSGANSNGSDSRIENALAGVLSLDGGIVDCNNTTFSNNNLGGVIATYGFGHVLSKFNDCTFETTIKDKFTTPGWGGRSHILLIGVKNQLLINSSDFFNANLTSLSNPTIFGILAISASFKVIAGAESDDPSQFYNLNYGIYSIGNKTTAKVKGSVFKDCNVGIYNTGSHQIDVLENQFNFGGLPFNTTIYALPDQFGVWFKNEHPVLSLTSNIFQRSTFTNIAPNHTIGSFAQNVGDFNNVFSQNKYYQIDFANLANEHNGNNKGLHYLCNDNFGPQIFDFAVEQDASIRQDQGQANFGGTGFGAAANTFSYTNGNNGDFSDFLNDGGIVRYYWRNAANEEPLDYLNISPIQVPSAPPCAYRQICPEPCKTPTEVAEMKTTYYTQKTAYTAALYAANQAQQANNTSLAQQYGIQASSIKDRMDFLVGSILSDEINSLNRQDTVRKWIGNFDRIAADYYVARNFFDNGRPTSADSVLLLIPSKFTLSTTQIQETAAMRQMVSLLTGKDIFNLNETTLSTLETVAGNEFSQSGDWARSILLYYGNWFQPTYKLPAGSGERSTPSNSTPFASSIHLFPNPVRQTLHVRATKSMEEKNISIYNNLGELVGKYQIEPWEEGKTLDVSTLSSGIFFIQVTNAQGIFFTEKLVVQH